jgi:hypothetical protein
MDKFSKIIHQRSVKINAKYPKCRNKLNNYRETSNLTGYTTMIWSILNKSKTMKSPFLVVALCYMIRML